jgi:hypothetical protein
MLPMSMIPIFNFRFISEDPTPARENNLRNFLNEATVTRKSRLGEIV